MSLREKLAAARERDRQEREANREASEASQRRYTKARELQKLGVSAMTPDGWPDPALTEEALDAMLAAEKDRRAESFQSLVRAGTVTTFRALGVQVLAGDVQV